MTSTATRIERLENEVGALVASHGKKSSVAALRKYARDPVGFIEKVLGARLTKQQCEIAEAVRDERQVAVRSCNGAGKDFLAGRLALWWTYCRGGFVLVTGPTERQVKVVVMGEVRRAFDRARSLPGQLFELALKDPGEPQAGILAFTSNDVSKITGFHAPRLLVIVTEAQGIEPFAWEGILANATGADTRILAVGNPLVATGKFFEICRSERWRRFHLSAFDHPNVVEGREVIPGAVTREFIAQMEAEYGAGSNTYRARVLGEFPDENEEGLIRRSWLDAAAARWESGELEPAAALEDPCCALDPARLGADSSALAIRQGPVLRRLVTWSKLDTMQTVERTMVEAERSGVEAVGYATYPEYGAYGAYGAYRPRIAGRGELVVDEIGVGAGVLDRLRQLNFEVVAFNSGRQATKPERFLNRRAETYWHLRKLLEDGRIALPRDERLFDELTAIRWMPTPEGKVKIELKDETRSRLGRSPDRADAVAMAFSRFGGPGTVPDLPPSHW